MLLAGCGSSDDLPPAAGPDRSPPLEHAPAGQVIGESNGIGGEPVIEVLPAPATEALVHGGRKRAVVRPRERVLEVYDAETGELLGSAPAGAGPTGVAAGEGGLAYVVDTAGDGLLVFETTGTVRIRRRYPLPGAPYGIASDLRRSRLWVTLTARNELVELATSARPRRLASYPTVRQPNAVTVDPQSGAVYVTGDGELQLLEPDRAAPSR